MQFKSKKLHVACRMEGAIDYSPRVDNEPSQLANYLSSAQIL